MPYRCSTKAPYPYRQKITHARRRPRKKAPHPHYTNHPSHVLKRRHSDRSAIVKSGMASPDTIGDPPDESKTSFGLQISSLNLHHGAIIQSTQRLSSIGWQCGAIFALFGLMSLLLVIVGMCNSYTDVHVCANGSDRMDWISSFRVCRDWNGCWMSKRCNM